MELLNETKELWAGILDLSSNYLGEIVATKITAANVSDTQHLEGMASDLPDNLYANKVYISKALESSLLEQGATLVTNVYKNMKARGLSIWDRAMLSRRFIIETINDQLKNISHKT